MIRRHYELTDRAWVILSPLLSNKPRGVPRGDDRRILSGILWRFRTGSPWAEIPERYGPLTTCYNRFVHWRKAGANIPPKANRTGSFVCSSWVYRQRNLVERFFNKIKQFRASPHDTINDQKTSWRP